MKLRRQLNSVYFCEYHLVFPTKYRRKIFNEGVFAYLEQILKKIKDYYPEVDLLEMNRDEDHIHLLLSIPPKMTVGNVVRIIKANTARLLRQKFDHLNKVNRLRKLPVVRFLLDYGSSLNHILAQEHQGV